MEIADVFVINKADRDGVDRTVHDLEAMLGLAETQSAWRPPIVQTVATRNEGIDGVLAEIQHHRRHLRESGELAERRRQLLRLRVEAILKERVLAEADASLGLEAQIERGLAEHDDPYRVADRLYAGAVRSANGETVTAADEETA